MRCVRWRDRHSQIDRYVTHNSGWTFTSPLMCLVNTSQQQQQEPFKEVRFFQGCFSTIQPSPRPFACKMKFLVSHKTLRQHFHGKSSVHPLSHPTRHTNDSFWLILSCKVMYKMYTFFLLNFDAQMPKPMSKHPICCSVLRIWYKTKKVQSNLYR